MSDLVLSTFDWVPEAPRGYVRDLRVRWALEEAGLTYRVESVPFRDRKGRTFLAPALWPGAVADGWRKMFDDFLKTHRLEHLEAALVGRQWLAGTFSVADILMADVLRLVARLGGLEDYPACRAYVARATARPAFVKAPANQMAHFAAAD